ncbi:MAG: trigger factor [Oscillospiraceae bacterium]|nr:trigger factor [Clostridiales bacterium]MDY2690835.1 trigger factor [Oscillospiraceae bacterium]
MNVKSVEKENGKAKVVVEIDKPEFEQALNKAYAKCRKDIMLPGFRKGKAPRKMVESMYGATVFYEDAVNEIFPEIYTTAIVDQQLKAVGSPSVSNMDTPDEGGVVLTIETELYPEVTLGQYKGIEVPKREVKVEDSEVDAELSRMAERNARIETVDRAAQMGDTVVIDFEGFEGGKPFQGGKAEDYSLTLGSGSFIPGFEEALVGAVAGEERDVNVTFPENYAKELAGKPAVFKCKVHEVKESIKPELDDEFAKDVSEFDTLDALKNDIRERFTKSREEQNERAFESSAVQLAAANMTCNVPACMIDEQVDHQIEQFAYQLQSQGMKMEDYTKMIGGDLSSLRQSMRPMAEQTVRSDILLSEIARTENLEVTDEEVEEELKKLAEQYQMELDKVKAAVDTAAVKSDLMGKKAAKIITDNAVAVAPTEEKKDDADTSEKE